MKHFDFGYKISDDGINTGLHEMAHALLLQHQKTPQKYAFIKKMDIDKLYKISHKVSKVAKIDKGLYNRYAFTNFHEFFAKTVELYFEKPRDLYRDCLLYTSDAADD